MPEKNWWFAEGSQSCGPISEDDMRAKIARRELTPDSLVWTPGLAEWVPANETRFKPAFDAPASTTPDEETVFAEEAPPASAPLAAPLSAEVPSTEVSSDPSPAAYAPPAASPSPSASPALSGQDVYPSPAAGYYAPPAQEEPKQKINNVFAWLLAFLPLIFLVIDTTGFMSLDNLIGIFYWIGSFVQLSMGLLFWLLDMYCVRRAGYNVRWWGAWGFFFTPVYFFFRAHRTDKNYTFAIISVVLVIMLLLLIVILLLVLLYLKSGLSYSFLALLR